MAFFGAEAYGHELEGFFEVGDGFLEFSGFHEGFGESGLEAVGVVEVSEGFFVSVCGFLDEACVEVVICGFSLADGDDDLVEEVGFFCVALFF